VDKMIVDEFLASFSSARGKRKSRRKHRFK
jgi:hypothetical protein